MSLAQSPCVTSQGMGFVVRHGKKPMPSADRERLVYRGTEGGEAFAHETTPVDVETVAEKHGEKMVVPRVDHLLAFDCRRLFRRLPDRRRLRSGIDEKDELRLHLV